jgi:hypothetical protein
MWKVDQVSDGTYRIAAKQDKQVLSTAPSASAVYQIILKPYPADEDMQRWVVTTP